LSKLYPALLLPALVRRRPVSGAVVAGALVGAAYLPHILAVGPKVLGYLPGYLHEEGYTQGTRFLLLNAVGIPERASQVLAVIALMATAAWLCRRGGDPAISAGRLLR